MHKLGLRGKPVNLLITFIMIPKVLLLIKSRWFSAQQDVRQCGVFFNFRASSNAKSQPNPFTQTKLFSAYAKCHIVFVMSLHTEVSLVRHDDRANTWWSSLSCSFRVHLVPKLLKGCEQIITHQTYLLCLKMMICICY